MERSPISLIEPVPGIKRQELDLGSLGQIGRLVNDESPGLHSSLQSHAITVAPQPVAPQGLLSTRGWEARAIRPHADQTSANILVDRTGRDEHWRSCSATMPSGSPKPSEAAQKDRWAAFACVGCGGRLLAAGHFRLPEEIRGHRSPQFPHKADWPLALVRDVVCRADERVWHRATVLLLSWTHE